MKAEGPLLLRLVLADTVAVGRGKLRPLDRPTATYAEGDVMAVGSSLPCVAPPERP
jgi:hypothetical protein